MSKGKKAKHQEGTYQSGGFRPRRRDAPTPNHKEGLKRYPLVSLGSRPGRTRGRFRSSASELRQPSFRISVSFFSVPDPVQLQCWPQWKLQRRRRREPSLARRSFVHPFFRQRGRCTAKARARSGACTARPRWEFSAFFVCARPQPVASR